MLAMYDSQGEALAGGMMLIAACIAYFIPAVVAHSRKKRNASAITALNFFLGWTVIGWVVALVWAMTVDVGSGSGQ